MDHHQHLEWPQIVANVRAHESGQRDLALVTAEDGNPVFPVCPKFQKAADRRQLQKRHDRCCAHQNLVEALALRARRHAHRRRHGIVGARYRRGGRGWFQTFLAGEGLETEDDLTDVWAITPSGGRHYYFEFEHGTCPKTRAGDIAPNVDSRELGGSIIIPGNRRRDGRSYIWGGRGRHHDVRPMPRKLLYLKTFNANERRLIMDTPKLKEAMKWANPAEWISELEAWRHAEQERISAKLRNQAPDGEGMRRQATNDLAEAAAEVAGLEDGRRTKLFSTVCAVGKYVAHGVLTESEFRCAFMDAAGANGSLRKYRVADISNAIRNALTASSNDPLPLLARKYLTGGNV